MTKMKKLLVIGGVVVLSYKIGTVVGAIKAHNEFVNEFGEIIFEKTDSIGTHVIKNGIYYTSKNIWKSRIEKETN